MKPLSFETDVITAANHCVACGLCLPQCPTYTVAENEAESPRGRISLIKALAQGKLQPDTTCIEHLQGCLLCRRCEAVCPANVPFGYLMDQTRKTLFAGNKINRPLPRWLSSLIRSRFLQLGLLSLLWLYYRSGIRMLLHKSKTWHKLKLAEREAMLPTHIPWLPHPAPDKCRKHPAIALFTGCVAKAVDTQTLSACVQLIEQTGHAVALPAKISCCGALHQHAGDYRHAQRLLNDSATALQPFNTVISCASGCGLHLMEHQSELDTQHEDIHTFLTRYANALHFHPLNKTVALHTPCTFRYMSQNRDTITPLLKKIAGLTVKPLPSICCGAAGAYMLTQRHTATAILDKIITMIEAMNIDLLLTANVGCAMHLRAALAKRRLPIETLHPATLLARQLKKP